MTTKQRRLLKTWLLDLWEENKVGIVFVLVLSGFVGLLLLVATIVSKLTP